MDPMRGTWGGFWFEFAVIHAILVAIVIIDVLPGAIRRWRDGGSLLAWSDFAARRYTLIYTPFVVAVLAWEHGFGYFGFGLRDDDPYFLGLMAVLAISAFLLVRWAKRQH